MQADNDVKNKIKKSWKNLGVIFLAPIFISIIVAVVFCCVSIIQENKILIGIFGVIANIFSGIAGGLILKEWGEIENRNILLEKGKSATRSLGLLRDNIFSLKNEVSKSLKQTSDKEKGKNLDLIKNNFESTIERCELLNKSVINSIEEWKDIIPEADITSSFTKISDLEKEIKKLREEKSKDKEENDRKIKQLEFEILKEINSLKDVGVSGIAGVSVCPSICNGNIKLDEPLSCVASNFLNFENFPHSIELDKPDEKKSEINFL